MVSYDAQTLYNALHELAVIPEHILSQVLEESKLTGGKPFHELLLEKGLISDRNLGKVIADTLGLPFVHLSEIPISPEVLKIVPELVAKRQKIIAFVEDKDGVKLAMADPSNQEIVRFLEKKTGEKLKVYLATERDITETFRLYKKELQKTFDELLEEQIVAAGRAVVKEAPVAKIVDLLIEYAYQNKTSDIHIEPKETDSLVRFRIDGVLHDVLHLPIVLHPQIATRIKVLSKLRTDEHLSAQDGKMQIPLEEENLDVRVSVVPIVEGEKVVLRLLSSKSRQFSLADLGMNQRDLKTVSDGFTKPYGMVLATGPTGSGKTTTIYAIVKIINTREKNIATIEDPVEYDIEGINQIQVNPKTNLTFAQGLRSILRQDPDIIFVGEIRDEETAKIAINAAMTGHLVLSTVHTNDAATTLPRLIDMGVEPFLVASTVNVIVAQRLVRKICNKCRVSYTKEASALVSDIAKTLIQTHLGERKEVRMYRGKGCQICHYTGYVGRVGIFEVLSVSEDVRKLITAKEDSSTIAKRAIEEGMSTMLEDGLDKVARGVTTIEEVLRATKE